MTECRAPVIAMVTDDDAAVVLGLLENEDNGGNDDDVTARVVVGTMPTVVDDDPGWQVKITGVDTRPAAPQLFLTPVTTALFPGPAAVVTGGGGGDTTTCSGVPGPVSITAVAWPATDAVPLPPPPVEDLTMIGQTVRLGPADILEGGTSEQVDGDDDGVDVGAAAAWWCGNGEGCIVKLDGSAISSVLAVPAATVPGSLPLTIDDRQPVVAPPPLDDVLKWNVGGTGTIIGVPLGPDVR